MNVFNRIDIQVAAIPVPVSSESLRGLPDCIKQYITHTKSHPAKGADQTAVEYMAQKRRYSCNRVCRVKSTM